ncbi:FG-GAP-like repeat-containing protein [bacterium]|nr:FG-GAP-like repeat-containing protein [bacterium]
MRSVILLILLSSSLIGQNLQLRKHLSLARSSAATMTSGIPRHVNVLALRVQFRLEDPDNDRTTGNGHFDLGANPNRTIDPPPHNKRYFEDQLLAMKNYFLDVSDSNLIIDYTVKPDNDDEAITLNKFMREYGRDASEEQRSLRLAEFFYDAIAKADSMGTIDFSLYDYVIIFHAGVGQDFSRSDNTPDDLSSRFVTLDLLQQRFGSTFDGVPVNNDNIKIHNGIVVPETETQALIDPFFGLEDTVEVGLTGILVSNFGSQLGMPDLFNTSNGTNGIGVFGLEDQGALNGDGLIPAEPDPWTKIYMGWAAPIVISDSINLMLSPKKIAGKNTIIKVPINSSEYFLIENKQQNVIPDELSPTFIFHAIKDSNESTGVVTYDTLYKAGAIRSSETKVITNIDEYDSALPGNGLLIWHIDEKIITSNLISNSINNDPNRRGVRLVEASGSQDIGFTNSGDLFDFYFKGNEAFAVFNQNVDSIFLTPFSVPNSLSNDRANHGITISQISTLQPIMSMNIRTSLMQKGFPQYTGERFGFNSVTYGDIAGDTREEIIAASSDGSVWAWNSDGKPVITSSHFKTYYGLGGDSTEYPVAFFASTSDSILVSPALADLDNDGKSDIIVGTKSGHIVAWKAEDADVDQSADTLFVYQTGNAITSSPMIMPDKKIIAGCQNGLLVILNSNGTLANSVNLSHPILSTALFNNDSVLVSTSSELIILSISTMNFSVLDNASGSFIAGDLSHSGRTTAIALDQSGTTGVIKTFLGPNSNLSFSVSEKVFSQLSMADIDKDGFLEIVLAGSNKIYAFNHNGSLVTNFPITLNARNPVGLISSSVLIGDIDGDNAMDLLTAASNGLIHAYDLKGSPKSGFPLATGQSILGSPAILDADHDGDIEIVAACEDGFIYMWDLPGTYNSAQIKWGQFLHDAVHSAFTDEQATPITPGNELMPKRSVYNYPNPARGESTTIRYYLSEQADVTIHIVDLAGDLVQTLRGPGAAATDNEVVWPLNKIQSGIYFAKITAKTSGGKKSTRTIKIAVSK